MGLFRNKSGDGNHPHGVLGVSGSQTLGDPENPQVTFSAPHAIQDTRQQQQQQQYNQAEPFSSWVAATAPPAGSSSSNTYPDTRMISAPQLGQQQQQQVFATDGKQQLTPAQQRTLQNLQRLTTVMDSAITIPLINKKIGLDGIIGLVPYVGDLAGATIGTYFISRALKYNLPKRLVLHMLVNQAIDSCFGIIPFFGDIFDFGIKANTRNMKLLQDHLERPAQAKRADACFLCSFFFLVVVVPVMLFAGIVVAIVLGVLAGLGKL